MDFITTAKQTAAQHKAIANACQRLLRKQQTESTGEMYIVDWSVLDDGRFAIGFGCESSCESGEMMFKPDEVEAAMRYTELQRLF